MSDPALMHLIWMLTKGALRQAGRLMKKPAGAIATLFMIGIFSFGMMPTLMLAFSPTGVPPLSFAGLLIAVLPVVMFSVVVSLIVTESGMALLELKPPELQFVLAGPFSNSHILSYRLATLLFGWVPLSAFFSLFLLAYLGSYVGGFIGIALSGIFLTLIAFQYTLLKPNLSPRISQSIRLAFLFAFTLVVAETGFNLVYSSEPYSIEMLQGAIDRGWIASAVGLPFRSFANVTQSTVGLGLLTNTAVCLLLISIVLFGCYRANAGFAELAVEGVARRRVKLERIKSGNVYALAARKKERQQLFPPFAWLGGVGPVAWSQLTSVFRRTGRLIPGVLILGAIVAVIAGGLLQLAPTAIPGQVRRFAVPISLGAACYIGFLVMITAQTGFTSNRRLLTWYQMLPIAPVSIGTGMVVGTATLLIAIQIGCCIPALVISSDSLLQSISILFAGAAFAIAVASVSNFVSVVTDLRPMPQGTPDMFQGARAMIYMLVLGMAMTPILLFAAGVAGIALVVGGLSIAVGSLGAGLGMLASVPVLWWYSGERFVRRELMVE